MQTHTSHAYITPKQLGPLAMTWHFDGANEAQQLMSEPYKLNKWGTAVVYILDPPPIEHRWGTCQQDNIVLLFSSSPNMALEIRRHPHACKNKLTHTHATTTTTEQDKTNCTLIANWVLWQANKQHRFWRSIWLICHSAVDAASHGSVKAQ